MDEMKDRCILNDTLISKYKFPSPAASSTITSPGPSVTELQSARRTLFFEERAPSDTSFAFTHGTSVAPPAGTLIAPTSTILTVPLVENVNATAHQIQENIEVDFHDDFQLVEEGKEHAIAEEIRGEGLHHVDSYVEEDVDDPREINAESDVNEEPLRTSSKKYFCPFCRQLYSKFARHIFQVHGGEEEVKVIAELGPKDPNRIRNLAKLRADGSRIYNQLQTTPEKLILPRKKKNVTKEDYISCYMCGNMYKKRFLHRHVKICPSSDGTHVTNPLRTAKIQSYESAEDNESIIKFSKDVLSGIREGEVKRTIETDSLLREYGIYLCSLYGGDFHLVNLIRRKLRQVAEVVLETKKLDKEILNLEDIFVTTKKQVLFKAIKNVTGFESGSVKRPALANELGTLLQHCAKRLISKLLEANDKERIKDVRRWIELIKSDYNALISKHARKSLDEKKWNKPRTLPLTEDLLKLNNHLKDVLQTSTTNLKKGFTINAWEDFNKATMVKIVIFNRKRVGDIQRIRLVDFNKSHNVQQGTITYQLLSESERLTCSKYMRVEVRGKHAKVVPVLLTKEIMSNIRSIISLRKRAKIPDSNPYVFAKNSKEPFSASRALNAFAYNCGATNPQLLTGTKLRKEIATATQAFNFSENDLSVLANYLGHTLQTHKNFYRLPDEAIHLAKISKLLEIVDDGKASELKGKSLSELEQYVTSKINEDNTQGK